MRAHHLNIPLNCCCCKMKPFSEAWAAELKLKSATLRKMRKDHTSRSAVHNFWSDCVHILLVFILEPGVWSFVFSLVKGEINFLSLSASAEQRGLWDSSFQV